MPFTVLGDTAVITTLDHVQLAMPRGREDEANAFYGELLWLREIQKPLELRARSGVWFVLADG